MKPEISIIFFLLVFIGQCFGQQVNYPAGGYMSLEELKNKQPSIAKNFVVRKRTRDAINAAGGSDYMVISPDKSVKKNFIKKKLFAVSTGDSLYINCYFHGIQKWYSKVISAGEIFLFYGPMNDGDMDVANSKVTDYAIMGGIIGVGLSGIGKIVDMRFLYVLDTTEPFPIARPVNEAIIRQVLEPYPLYLYQYENDPEKEKSETILHYLKMVNE